MSYIQSAYINALLADATYIDLPMVLLSESNWKIKRELLLNA